MKLLRLLVFVLVFAGAASVASAQTAANLPRGNISGFGSYAVTASDGLDQGYGFGASASFFFSPSIGVEGGWRRTTFDLQPSEANSLSGGDLNANVVTANVVVRIPSGRLQPYVSGGLAFYVNGYTIDPAVEQQLRAFNFTSAETIENAVGFNVAGGFDFQASARLGFFVEGRFAAAKADTVGSLTDLATQITATSPGEQELNFFAVGGGIRIYF